MKKLNIEEVRQFAGALVFDENEARDITDLFYRLKAEGDWRVDMPLNDVDEYIREWENHWHRENNIQECFEYERDNQFYEYDPEVVGEIFESVEAFKKFAMEDKRRQFVFSLPSSEMVVVVC